MSEEEREGGENCIMRSFMICTTRIIISVYQIKNEMGGANGTHEEKRKIFTEFWLQNPKERDRVEDQRTDGM